MQKNNFIKVITLIFIASLYCSCKSNISDNPIKGELNYHSLHQAIKDTVTKIAEYNSIDSKQIGIGGINSLQWHRQEWITKHLKTAELLVLKDHSNSTVKALAWKNLVFKDFPEKFEMFKQVMKDTSIVYIQAGCLGLQMPLAEYITADILKIGGNVPPPPPSYFSLLHFSKTELDALNQIYHQFQD